MSVTQTKSPPRGLARELLRELSDFLRRSVPGRWGFALTLLLVIVALAAPWLAPYDPVAQNLPARLVAPTAAHWMGTDELGRDILSRIIFGTRVSMLVSICVVFGAGIIGLAIGAVAGYFGGWFDRFVNIILINAFLSFPGILLAIAFAAFLGPGLDKVILALVVTGWAGYARLARAQILQAKEMEYVLAARSLGASHARILVRHLLPNILQPILVQATIAMAGAILAESTLSFLGVVVLAQLGRYAQRRARPPLRRPAPGDFPSPRSNDRRPSLQPPGRRPPRLARPPHALLPNHHLASPLDDVAVEFVAVAFRRAICLSPLCVLRFSSVPSVLIFSPFFGPSALLPLRLIFPRHSTTSRHTPSHDANAQSQNCHGINSRKNQLNYKSRLTPTPP